MVNRRNFLQGAAAATAYFIETGIAVGDPLGLPIGCQTYPVRHEVQADFPGAMQGLHAAGFTSIELCSPFGYPEFAGLRRYKPQELRRMLNDWGLTCVSAHWSPEELYQRPDESIEYATAFGMTQMGVAALGPFDYKGTETASDVKRYVEPFNAFAEKAHSAGITALLHNEGFVSAHINGKPVYDMMIAELNPATVKLQFQIAAMQEGYQPVAYFNKYPGRFLSMHCQDWIVDPSTKSGFRQVALGKGVVDWKAVFTGAKVGGVKNYFVELWEDPKLMSASVPYLRGLSV